MVTTDIGAVIPTGRTIDTRQLVRVFAYGAICVLFAELIGSITIPLGGKVEVVLLPFIWALFR